MSTFQAFVCNDYDLEKLPFTIKQVTVPLRFVLEKMVLGMNFRSRTYKQTRAPYKDSDQDRRATQKRTLTTVRTENNWLKEQRIQETQYLPSGGLQGERTINGGWKLQECGPG